MRKKLWNKKILAMLLAVAMVVTSISTDGLSVLASVSGDVETVTAEAEESADAVKCPAAEFSQTMEDGTTISVSAPEGAFPEGVTMTVTMVDAADVIDAVAAAASGDVAEEDIYAYDISFYDAAGQEVEPTCDINVTMANEALEADAVEVYHMDDVNAEAEVVGEDLGEVVDSEDGSVEIESDEFSIYVILDSQRTVSINENDLKAIGYTVANAGNYSRWGYPDSSNAALYLKRKGKIDVTFTKDSNSDKVTPNIEECFYYYVDGSKTPHLYTIVNWKYDKDKEYLYFQYRFEANQTSSWKIYLGTNGDSVCWIVTPKVTYDANGGSNLKVSSAKISDSGKVTLPAANQVTAPTGKTLIGWAKNKSTVSSLSDVYAPGTEISVSDGDKFYAIYGTLVNLYTKEANETEWYPTIANHCDLQAYVLTDGTLLYTAATQEKLNQKYGADRVAKIAWNKKQDGSYDFFSQMDDWNGTSSEKGSSHYHLNGSVPANTVTVSFDLNGGNTLSKSSATYSVGTVYGQLPTAGKNGNWAFAGWFTEKTGGTQVTETTKVTENDATTLYAHWTKTGFNVKYVDADGKEIKSEENVAVYSLPSASDKTGYTYKWVANGQEVRDGDKVSADTTVSLVYTANCYTVTYNLNGGVSDTNTKNKADVTETVTYDASYKNVPAPYHYAGLRWQYEFAGWTTDKDYAEKQTGNKPDSEIDSSKLVDLTGKVAITANTTYYAVYKASKVKYDVTFDLNGGSIDSSTANVVLQMELDDTYPTPTVEPTRENYRFVGWKATVNEKEVVLTTAEVKAMKLYNNGYKEDYQIDGPKTFTAVWSKTTLTVSAENATATYQWIEGNTNDADKDGYTDYTIDPKVSDSADSAATLTNVKITYYSDAAGTTEIDKPSYDSVGTNYTYYYKASADGYDDTAIQTGTLTISYRAVPDYKMGVAGTASQISGSNVYGARSNATNDTNRVKFSAYKYVDKNTRIYYSVSFDGEKTWKDSKNWFALEGADTEGPHTYTYQLMDSKGYITDVIGDGEGETPLTYTMDYTAPYVSYIKVGSTSILNTVLRFFGKNTASVTVAATDGKDTAGVYKIYYQLAEDGKYSLDGTWTDTGATTFNTKQTFTIDASQYDDQNFVGNVYLKLVDNVGNTRIVNSDGLVVYTDAAADTTEFTYYLGTNCTADGKGDGLSIPVNFNGNGVKSLYMGKYKLTRDKEYTVDYKTGNIVLTASYLQKLAADQSYVFTLTFNPAKQKYENTAAGSQNADSLTLTVNVKKTTEVISMGDLSKTYDNTAVSPTITRTSDSFYTGDYKRDQQTASITYYQKNSDGSWTKLSGAPKDAGDYKIVVATAADDNFTAAEATQEFTISPIEADGVNIWIGIGKVDAVTYDGNAHNATPATYIANAAGKINVDGNSNAWLVEGKDYEYSYKNVATGEVVTECKDAGTYEVVITLKGNYKGQSGVGEKNYQRTFTIKPLEAQLSYTISDGTHSVAATTENGKNKNPAQVTYSALPYTVTATVTNAVEGDTFDITFVNDGKKATDYCDTRTSAGITYKSKVNSLGNSNYKLPTTESLYKVYWTINYLVADDASLSGQQSNYRASDFWYTGAVTLKADGYTLTEDDPEAEDATWSDSITRDKDTAAGEISYQLKDAAGYITAVKTAEYGLDTKASTGRIDIGSNRFTGIKDAILSIFYKNQTKVILYANSDSTSRVNSIYYHVEDQDGNDVTKDVVNNQAKGETYDEETAYVKTGNTSSKTLYLPKDGTYVVYEQIIDNAGNVTTINSDGVVIYSDSSTDVTDEVTGETQHAALTYTRTTADAQNVEISLNGNTIKNVSILTLDADGETIEVRDLIETEEYTVDEDGLLTISGRVFEELLPSDALEGGSYEIVISYNPYGVDASDASQDSESAEDSIVDLTVVRAEASIEALTLGTITYPNNGTVQVKAVSDGKLSVSSSDQEVATVSIDDQGLITVLAGTKAGTATITVNSAQTDNYEATSTSFEVVVENGSFTATATGYTGTYDGNAHGGVVTSSLEGAVITYGLSEGTYDLTEAPTFTEAGTYMVYYQVEAAGYNTLTGSYQVVISQIPAAATDTSPASVTASPAAASAVSETTAANTNSAAVTTAQAATTPAATTGAATRATANAAANNTVNDDNDIDDRDDTTTIEDQDAAASDSVDEDSEDKTIEDEESAKDASVSNWSLADLLLMIVVVLEALAMAVAYIRKQDKAIIRLASIPVGLVSVFALIFSQDFAGSHVIVDNWTVAFAILFAIQTVLTVFSNRQTETAEEKADK